MKCVNCGAEIKAGSRFCEYCGTQITGEMLKEQEQLNKAGCPRCGSTNIEFRREDQGEIRDSRSKIIMRATVGCCRDCGYTWIPEGGEPPKKRRTWLWVLGWLCLFPVPLTILLLRKKDMKKPLKYGLVAAAWILYFMIGAAHGGNSTTQTGTTAAAETAAVKETVAETAAVKETVAAAETAAVKETGAAETEAVKETAAAAEAEQAAASEEIAAETESSGEETKKAADASQSPYQAVYDEYSEKLREATPGLVKEYQEEAKKNTGGLDGLAEMSNEKIGILAEISNKGIGEMAEIMLFSGAGGYSEYEKWAGMLTDVYMEEAGKITDAYMRSAL